MSDVDDPNEGTGPEHSESMDAAHAEVAAAEAKSDFTGAATEPERPENMEAAHAEVAAAEAKADWENVGTQKFDPSYQPVKADWSNAGVGTWQPPDQLPWVDGQDNVGLQKIGPAAGQMLTPAPQSGITMTTSVGLSVFFTVTLDAVDLGYWSKISGLGMSISTTDRGETAMNFFQHHLPAHLTYDKITLERPVSPNSVNIMNWISAYHMLPVPSTGQICCLGDGGEIIMTWEMIGITPVSYKGPSFDAASTSPAVEQLTIQHMGFL